MSEQANPVPDFAEGVIGQDVKPFSPEEREALSSYFERQSERLTEVFGRTDMDDPDTYLLNQSQKMMKVLAFMQLPWYKYIPVLHESFVLYLEGIEGKKAHKRAFRLTGDLMRSVSEMSQLGNYVIKMINFYQRQVCDLKTLRSMDEVEKQE